MNEFIAIQFRKNGKRLRVKRQLPGGIEFDEADPFERTVGVGFGARNPITQFRMDSIQRIQGWDPGQFKLNMAVEEGAIVLRGVNEHALPEGDYDVRIQIEEVKIPGGRQRAQVRQDGHADVTLTIEMDDRDVEVDLNDVDPDIEGVLTRSKVDGTELTDWVQDTHRRPTRRACLLNLLGSLRTRPTKKNPLIPLVHNVFLVANDRLYAKVDRTFKTRLEDLVKDPTKPFYAEGPPHAAIHGRLVEEIPETPETKARFGKLFSFRGEGKPSMQVVIATPPPDLPHTYAEFDLDLGNPLQDVFGFFVHVGELLDGKPTNHLDLRKSLAKTSAGDFLYYRVLSG